MYTTESLSDAVSHAQARGDALIYRCPDGLWAVGGDEEIDGMYPDAIGEFVSDCVESLEAIREAQAEGLG